MVAEYPSKNTSLEKGSSPSDTEFTTNVDLPTRLASWKKNHQLGTVVLEIGSHSNNRDRSILQSSRPDIPDQDLMVIHIDPLNERTDRVNRNKFPQTTLIVADEFDSHLASTIKNQVDLAVVVGLIPEKEVEDTILDGLEKLAPHYVYLYFDTNSGDRLRSGRSAKETLQYILHKMTNYSREEDVALLPAHVVPNSGIITAGNAVKVILERNR